MKRCARCKEEKVKLEFWTNKARKDGLTSSCKKCVNELARSPSRLKKRQLYENKARPKHRNYQLSKKFGIDLQTYQNLLLSQNGTCAICKTSKCQTNRNFAVDHDHATGKIRGLLCGKCNTAIGLLQSDSNPEVMVSAIDYIKKHSNSQL